MGITALDCGPGMPSAEKTRSVPAVDRVLSILELLAGSKRGLSAAELVELTGMPRSSVHCLTLTLERREISGTALATALIAFPFMTARVVAAIYWQALRLWVKRIPFHSHPARTHDHTSDLRA